MLRLALTRSALVHVLGRCLQRCLGTLLWHWLRLEWDAFSFWTRSKVVLAAVRRHAAVASNCSSNAWAGADALSFGARSRVVLTAVLRHTAMALAAAGVATAMHGLALTRSALCIHNGGAGSGA